jgi:hypothetical protein
MHISVASPHELTAEITTNYLQEGVASGTATLVITEEDNAGG